MGSEIWDLYDAHGRKTNQTMVRGEEVPPGLYHLAVHIWPSNDRGELLIQRRASTVQWNPNLWAVTGGSAICGEDALTAARRELREEIGIDAAPDGLSLIACLRRTNSFCSVYTLRLNRRAEDFLLQKEEVSEVRWCTPAALMRMVSENQLYNYGDSYFRMLFAYFKGRRQQDAAAGDQ